MSWELQSGTPLPTTAAWSSVASNSDGTKLVACVDNNSIYTGSFSDTSWTWTLQSGTPLPTTANWYSVASNSDGTKLVACVNNGSIYTGSYSGTSWTWTKQSGTPLPTTARWLSVASNSDGTKLVACAFDNSIYTGSYSDTSWTWILQSGTPLPTTQNWRSVASNSDGTKLVACALSNSIYTGSYSDTSWTWTKQSGTPLPTTATWRSVASNSDGNKLGAVINGGGIYTYNAPPPPSFTITPSFLSVTAGTYVNNYYTIDSTGGIPTSYSISPAVGNGLNFNTSTGLLSGSYNIPGTTAYTITGTNSGGNGIASFTLTFTPGMVCFLKDSKILTKQGYRPIQDLRKGDLIKTIKHGYLPIDMIGYREIFNPICEERIKDKLYVCSNQEYSEIFEDLVITGCHAILVGNYKDKQQEDKSIEVLGGLFLTDDKCRLPACVDERARPYEKEGLHTIYHLALENDDYFMNYGIYANGLIVETCSKRYLKELSNMTILNL